MVSPKRVAAALGAAALALQPVMAAAQQARPCIAEDEVSAIAIYSVPSLVQAVRLKCGSELSANGYLAKRGDAMAARYAPLQNRVWPKAKAGLLKVLAGRSTQGRQGLDMVTALPDNAVRPLVDALIVQELSPKIAVKHCGRLERVIELAAPIDPEVAGSILGVIAGIVDPDQMPVCPARRA